MSSAGERRSDVARICAIGGTYVAMAKEQEGREGGGSTWDVGKPRGRGAHPAAVGEVLQQLRW